MRLAPVPADPPLQDERCDSRASPGDPRRAQGRLKLFELGTITMNS